MRTAPAAAIATKRDQPAKKTSTKLTARPISVGAGRTNSRAMRGSGRDKRPDKETSFAATRRMSSDQQGGCRRRDAPARNRTRSSSRCSRPESVFAPTPESSSMPSPKADLQRPLHQLLDDRAVGVIVGAEHEREAEASARPRGRPPKSPAAERIPMSRAFASLGRRRLAGASPGEKREIGEPPGRQGEAHGEEQPVRGRTRRRRRARLPRSRRARRDGSSRARRWPPAAASERTSRTAASETRITVANSTAETSPAPTPMRISPRFIDAVPLLTAGLEAFASADPEEFHRRVEKAERGARRLLGA